MLGGECRRPRGLAPQAFLWPVSSALMASAFSACRWGGDRVHSQIVEGIATCCMKAEGDALVTTCHSLLTMAHPNEMPSLGVTETPIPKALPCVQRGR